MSLDPITLVVVAANVLGGSMAIPQAWKIARVRAVQGVSPGWAGISMALNGWWCGYGVAIDDLAIVPVSVVSLLAYAAIAGGLLHFGQARARIVRGLAVGAIGGSLVPATVLAANGWTAAGVALGLLYGAQLAPAVVTVYRSDDVGGVAASTWVIAAAEALLWITYGIAVIDAGFISFGVTGLAGAGLVLVRLVLRRPRGRAGDELVPGGLVPA